MQTIDELQHDIQAKTEYRDELREDANDDEADEAEKSSILNELVDTE